MDEQQQPLSWQFILLVVVFLLLIPVVIMAPGAENRAAPPVVATAPVVQQPEASPVELGDLSLTENYSDPNGVSLSYPAGWNVEAPGPGMVLISNYAGALMQAPAAANQTVILARIMAFADIGLEPGTQAADVMADLVTQSGGDPATMREVTVGGYPAMAADFSQNGLEVTLVLSTPVDGVLVMVELDTAEGSKEAVVGVFDEVVNSIVLPELTN